MTVTIGLHWLVTLLDDDFPDADDRAQQIATTAKLAVERYGPAAPDHVQNESFIRFATALATATALQNRHSITSGDLKVRFLTDDAGLFRRCGAAALLSPYKVRRGLAPVETADL